MNLTEVTWAHAVNSRAKLQKAFDDDVDMIECDIVLGTLHDDETQTEQPVMGHPPATTSDISLQDFLNKILEYNANATVKRGVKLDFKSTFVFNQSMAILEELWPQMDYPVWINADILPGPVNNTNTQPVDADFFLKECKKLTNATLSIGWTTRWGNNFTVGKYTEEQISEMIDATNRNKVTNPITFPIRAGIAANSNKELKRLYTSLNSTNAITFTIWSSDGDFVDIEKLQDFILDVGVNNIYLDVPQEVSDKLNLGSSARKITCASWINFIFLALILYKVFHWLN